MLDLSCKLEVFNEILFSPVQFINGLKNKNDVCIVSQYVANVCLNFTLFKNNCIKKNHNKKVLQLLGLNFLIGVCAPCSHLCTQTWLCCSRRGIGWSCLSLPQIGRWSRREGPITFVGECSHRQASDCLLFFCIDCFGSWFVLMTYSDLSWGSWGLFVLNP